MNISYEGMGQWSATFATTNGELGKAVKISGSGTVAACVDGDVFCGAVTSVSRDKTTCAVQLHGMVTLPYTGTAPVAGFAILAADASGGVKTAATGHSYLVVDVNAADKTVSFVL